MDSDSVGQDKPQQEAKVEMTLIGAIRELRQVSWKLNALVFGEKPSVEEKSPEPMLAGDVLTRARNDVQKITIRLRDIERKLVIIGK